MRALGQPALSRPAEGLYDPRFEHDACGVAFVATLTGVPSRTIVDQALTALRNLDHRGAAGAETNSGDGAGILFQVPDAFLREVVDFDLPPHHSYAVGTGFFAGDADDVTKSRQVLEEIAAEEGLQVLGWCEVPVQAEVLGSTARSAMPTFVQVFVAGAGSRVSGMALERRAFCLRKRAEKEADVYFPSLSARTLVYKGMLTTDQLDHFFPDLADPRVASALAVTGKTRSSPSSDAGPAGPSNSCVSSLASRARIRFRLPLMVLISPLCAMKRNGCASGQLGKVFVEKRECTTAIAEATRSSVRSGKTRSSWSVVSMPL